MKLFRRFALVGALTAAALALLAASALALISAPALAADKPAEPPKPAEHTVKLTDTDLHNIAWLVSTYGGEHCGVAKEAVQYCQGGIAGAELLAKLQAQLEAEATAAKVPAKH